MREIRFARIENSWAVAILLAGSLALVGSCGQRGAPRAIHSKSRVGSREVRLRELDSTIDRNFVVEVRSEADNEWTLVFQSPHERKPTGDEEFYWSEDGAICLLVGSSFFADAEYQIPDGRTAYLMVSWPGPEIRCNATQSVLARVSAAELKRYFPTLVWASRSRTGG